MAAPAAATAARMLQTRIHQEQLFPGAAIVTLPVPAADLQPSRARRQPARVKKATADGLHHPGPPWIAHSPVTQEDHRLPRLSTRPHRSAPNAKISA
jgi:hypothetical protein